MRPTISNSSTRRLTSVSACRPPKRMDVPATSRTDTETLRPFARPTVERELLALQPPPDRRGERPESFGLEDQREDGQHARQCLDDEPCVVHDETDVERLRDVGQVLTTQ